MKMYCIYFFLELNFRFDANLSEAGIKEAEAGGKALNDAGYTFDLAHTSLLTRAHTTLNKVLDAINQTNLPVNKTWRLNERHYGNLTGLNKIEMVNKHGLEKVMEWRRSYDSPPPPVLLSTVYPTLQPPSLHNTRFFNPSSTC